MPKESTLTFDWSEVTTINGESYPKDTLDRAKYAEFLTNYLVLESKNGGYVLNINASWGTGKTFFIRRWMETLETKHPVIYIDAWTQDYSNDPMLTVVSSIIDQLKSLQPPENEATFKLLEKSASFAKAAAPVLVRGLMKKALGADLFEINANNETTNPDNKSEDELLAETAVCVTNKLINDHNATLKSVEHFKRSITDWLAAINGTTKLTSPAFIFVDELDRCRPSYAVEMLEVIKHFFNLDNVIFVVATDTEQLQHAIKVVYGQEFDAQTYLGRFFRRRLTLKNMSRKELIQNKLASKNKFPFSQKISFPFIDDYQLFTIALSQLADSFELSLRETEQFIDQIESTLSTTTFGLNLYYLAILICCYDKHFSCYEKLISKVRFDNPAHNIRDYLLTDICSKPLTFNIDTFQECIYPSDEKTNWTDKSYSINVGELIALISESYKSTKMSQKLGQRTNNQQHNLKDLFKIHLHETPLDTSKYADLVELAVSFDE